MLYILRKPQATLLPRPENVVLKMVSINRMPKWIMGAAKTDILWNNSK
jgi:hypothetical protein